MYKLFQTLFTTESGFKDESDSTTDSGQLVSQKPLELQLTQADKLWKQGKITEAISLYCKVIEIQPNSAELYGQLSAVLKQQGELASAYKQLAIQLKQKGEVKKAASCYRQAIVLQALNYGTEKKYLQHISTPTHKPKLKAANLADSAFSFVQLSSLDCQPNKKRILQINLDDDFAENWLISPLKNPTKDRQTVNLSEEKAKIYMQQALEYCDRQQWDRAAIACEKTAEIDPNMAEAYKIWGNALQRMGKTAEAMDCYAKAVKIQPDLAEVYARIGSLYAQQKQWQPAIEYYQKALIIKPNFPQAYRSLAKIWYLVGETKKASFCRQQALNLESAQNNSHQNTNRGNELLLSSRAQREEVVREKNSTSKPNSVEEYQKLAQSLEKQNKWQEAATYYRKALEMNISELSSSLSFPETKQQNQFNRLEKLQKLLHEKSTEEASSTAIYDAKVQELATDSSKDISPQDLLLAPEPDREPKEAKSSTSKFLPTIKSNQSQLDKAINRYLKQAELKPDSAKIQTDLGNLYAKKRQWKAAIAAYHKAIQINERYAQAYLNLAKILAKVGKNRESVGYMYRALTLEPEIFSAKDYFYLGKCFIEQGKLRKGMSYCFKAIKLDPNYLEAYHHLGAVMSEKGQQPKAVNYFRQAIERNPQDPRSYYLLGQELARQKKWDEAVKAYSHVLELQPTFPQATQKLNHALAEKLKHDLRTKQN